MTRFAKIYLLVLSIFSAANAGHTVPEGCFATYDGGGCYGGYFFASDCDQYNMTSYNFGSYLYSACSYINSTESLLGTCIGDLSNSNNNLNTCIGAFNVVVTQRDSCLADKSNCAAAAVGIEQNRQEWIAYSNARSALIKKLYKVCGKKCKKIKTAATASLETQLNK